MLILERTVGPELGEGTRIHIPTSCALEGMDFWKEMVPVVAQPLKICLHSVRGEDGEGQGA